MGKQPWFSRTFKYLCTTSGWRRKCINLVATFTMQSLCSFALKKQAEKKTKSRLFSFQERFRACKVSADVEIYLFKDLPKTTV